MNLSRKERARRAKISASLRAYWTGVKTRRAKISTSLRAYWTGVKAWRAKISASLRAYWIGVKTGQIPRATYRKPIVSQEQLAADISAQKKKAANQSRRERYYAQKGLSVPKRPAKPKSPAAKKAPAKPKTPATKKKAVRPPKPERKVEEVDKYYSEGGLDFKDYADDRGSHIWIGPWRENIPSEEEVNRAYRKLKDYIENVADYFRSETVRLDLGLKRSLMAWALSPVINADKTVSSEVRVAIPIGLSISQVAQHFQNPLHDIGERYWVTPIIVYESRVSDEFGKPLPSPFEARDGKAEIRAFSVKADDNLAIKATTGFLKAEELADEWKEFIVPSYLRLKIQFSDRNPISIYEVRRREEARKEREARDKFLASVGMKPVTKRKK